MNSQPSSGADNISPITFDDYDCFSERDITEITSDGIWVKISSADRRFISFRECAFNFQRIRGGSGRCVAERDMTGSNPSFAFYTAPKTTHIFFLPEGKLKELFTKKNALERFHDLQNQILSFGFTTRDMS